MISHLRHATAAVFLLFASASSGFAADAKGGAVAGIPPGVVDGPTAQKLVANGVRVVDVRTPAEFASGHVPGAINIPYDDMARRHGEIGSASTAVLLYCRTGRRSEIAAKTLRKEGFSTIYDMQSFDRWSASDPKR